MNVHNTNGNTAQTGGVFFVPVMINLTTLPSDTFLVPPMGAEALSRISAFSDSSTSYSVFVPFLYQVYQLPLPALFSLLYESSGFLGLVAW